MKVGRKYLTILQMAAWHNADTIPVIWNVMLSNLAAKSLLL